MVIFTGKICATRLIKIFDSALVPFVKEVCSDGHRFMQDNDSKQSSRLGREFLEANDIFWWRTPPESADLNPIENVWGSLKTFLRDRHKPHNLETLISGIQVFWKTLTPEICCKYVRHIKKVIPKVIEERGGPSGF